MQDVPDITFNSGKTFDSSRLFTNFLKDIGAQLPAYGKTIELNREQSSQKGQIYIFENLQERFADLLSMWIRVSDIVIV